MCASNGYLHRYYTRISDAHILAAAPGVLIKARAEIYRVISMLCAFTAVEHTQIARRIG